VLAYITRLYLFFTGAFFNLMSTSAAKLLPQDRKYLTASISHSQSWALPYGQKTQLTPLDAGGRETSPFPKIVHALAAAQAVLLGVPGLALS
jgi:hypothetical protein